MNYPIWTIPYLGGTWIIGLISVFHLFVSHFAVGGGAYFALTEYLAFKRNDQRMYDYLKKHSLFFVLLTSVFGAVSGVGIWTAISLVSPNGTSSLIQTYTLGWACEYIFFVAELATIFVYYYTWNKISNAKHLQLARLYFFMSVMTLVIINGILTYMLTPGQWIHTHNWLHGFFNETYLPSLVIRLLMMFALSGSYALLTSSFIKSDLNFRSYMLRYSAKWFLPLFVLGPIVAYWYFINLPDASIATVFTGIQTSGIGNFSIMARAIYLSLILSGTIVIFVFVGPYLNPRGFSPKTAAAFMVCCLIVTGITEWSREMLRKPYVIFNYMYSNGLKKEEIAQINDKGFVNSSKWISHTLTGATLGKEIFKYQCMSCHTEVGYRGMKKLLGERNQDSILLFLNTLHETDTTKNPYHAIMPPLAGKPEEIRALSQYLAQLQQK